MKQLLDGVDYVDLKTASGPELQEGHEAVILYRVALSEEQLDEGDILESTYAPDVPVTIVALPNVLLPGIYYGILGMRAGGSLRRLRIAAQHAFGAQGYASVPPHATLVFDICVIQVRTQR